MIQKVPSLLRDSPPGLAPELATEASPLGGRADSPAPRSSNNCRWWSLFAWAVMICGWHVLVGTTDRVVYAQGLSPQEAVDRMNLPAGWRVETVVSEPLVRQPVAIDFDDRGRLWVLQYLQYPNPEGLRRVQVDRFSRTQYDRIPEPPPRGPRGADRLSILSDSDGDGQIDTARDFIDGLNLASGFAFGYGGVFVLNVPYLLFYPDHDRDDVPDADPRVLLTGFGMEDAHSVANSLTLGPDGWLYGCQGSTVTAKIRGQEFQQGVWRYHPPTDRFELFCEGGGNSWGLDFDETGRLFYSTNYGGHTLLHAVQGGYFVKSFGKHGALHNPHAYGYFDHAPHLNFQGGHVTVGGVIYQEPLLPAPFRGKFIAGDLLGHGVYWHTISPRGTTVQTAHGGELLVANDPWFAPTDITIGPDGAVYVADWHDARTAHPDPDAEWDRTNGRVYRITPGEVPRPVPFDLARVSVAELRSRLFSTSQWQVRRSRQELIRRRPLQPNQSVSPELANLTTDLIEVSQQSPEPITALEALWTVASLQAFTPELGGTLLASPHPAVRAWSVRLLGDLPGLSDAMAAQLDKLAEREASSEVRQQLACTTARLTPAQAMPILHTALLRDLDRDDPYLPLLWWWALEKQSVTGTDEVLRRFTRPAVWQSQLSRRTLLPRLIRRYLAAGTPTEFLAAQEILAGASDPAARRELWPAVWEGWREQSIATGRRREWLEWVSQTPLARQAAGDWQATPGDSTLSALTLAWGLPQTRQRVVQTAFDEETAVQTRVAQFDLLLPHADAAIRDRAAEVVTSSQPDAVRSAALRLLAADPDPERSRKLLDWYHRESSASLQSQIRDVLLSRGDSARLWLAAVDRGEIPAAQTPIDQIRRVALLEDEELDALVLKHWGRLQGGTREEKLAEVRRLNNDLRAAGGDKTSGRQLFLKHCATCHQLHGEGGRLGPDLTTANRKDRDFLLISLVDPSSVIRKEYVALVVETKSGQIFSGLPVVRSDAGVTLANPRDERTVIPQGDIAEVEEATVSFMPEDLYRQLKPQDLRDLFAYLQGP